MRPAFFVIISVAPTALQAMLAKPAIPDSNVF